MVSVRSLVAARRASSRTARLAASSRAPSRASCSPAGVRVTFRLVRTNRGVPISFSSCRICRDNAGWVMNKASAARPKWSDSATATK
jgi:hypothetical protein